MVSFGSGIGRIGVRVFHAPEGAGVARAITPNAHLNPTNRMSVYDLAKNKIEGKIVTIRTDFNGTADSGKIKSETRIDAALPTIKYMLDNGAKQIILLSHNGRPQEELKKGTPLDKVAKKNTLEPVAENLTRKLGLPVAFVKMEADKENASIARVIVSENSRLDPRDQSENVSEQAAYAMEITRYYKPDIFVMDGFSVTHRDEADTTVLARLMREAGKPAVAGHQLVKEYDFLINKLVKNPKGPFVVFLGGAKVSGPEGKMVFIKKLMEKADKVVIGGAMAYPFLVALGMKPGKNPLGIDEVAQNNLKNDVEAARELLADPAAKGKLVIPNTLIGADHSKLTVSQEEAPANFVMRDVSMAGTLAQIKQEIPLVGTVFFNGPFGVFEDFQSQGTNEIFMFMSWATRSGAITVIGGGETDKAAKQYKNVIGGEPVLTHKTTGGGASAELIRFGTLPGFEAMDKKEV